MKSRIGLFVFFDKDGVVDDYVMYLLNDIISELDRLVVIVNGKLLAEGRKKFETITKEIIVRENKGYDTAAWKEGILDYLGWKELEKYDEIVCFNDTFYGPLYSFKKVFEKMDSFNVDFWGLSCHDAAPDPTKKGRFGYWPRHIQSFFLVIRKRMHTSYEFKDYWENMPVSNNYHEVIANHETVFTEIFANAGYRWAVYSDTTDEETSINTSWCHYAFAMFDMIKNYKYPIIKKRPLTLDKKDILPFNNGDDIRRTLKFVKNETNYNLDLMWDNLLRTSNLYSIQNGLDLQYVFSDQGQFENSKLTNKIAVFLDINENASIKKFGEYLNNIPEEIDVYILCKNQGDQEHIKSELSRTVTIKKAEGSGFVGLFNAFREEMQDYEYIGMECDSKIDPQKEVSCENYEYLRYQLEGFASSRNYIFNIIKTFNNEDKLGLLYGVPAYFGKNFAKLHLEWDKKLYDECMALAENMKIKINIDPKIPPVMIERFFWMRASILKKLLSDSAYEKYSSKFSDLNGTLEKMLHIFLPYYAQSQKFYSGMVMTDEQAIANSQNMSYILANILKILEEKEGRNWNYFHVLCNENQDK